MSPYSLAGEEDHFSGFTDLPCLAQKLLYIVLVARFG